MPTPPKMTEHCFARMRFRHDWRSYQARVLAEMDEHLSDRKLHVVAAPGAGKTVLGLEVIRRLGLRALVLAPSLLVRDQWISRLRLDFLDGDAPEWISVDPGSDAPLRFSTYQNIHQNRDRALPPFDLLCLDEAHHLRRAWWLSLTRLAESHQPVTLSLTATPPYDADGAEWDNYNALCGPIDAEISVPELVRSGDLCPHQDLVLACQATDRRAYDENRGAEAALFRALRADPEVLEALLRSPWITDCRRHTRQILSDPELFSAMLIYLRDAGGPTPPYARRLLRLGDAEWPPLDWEWLRILFAGRPDLLSSALLSRLKAAGALRNDRLALPPPKFVDRVELLRDDAARLAATCEIHRLERENRGDDLRMAILLDRIGKSALKLDQDPCEHHDEYNAGAVFRALHAEGFSDDLALLTGQIACLPERSCAGLSGREVPGLPGYRLIAGADFGAAVARAQAGFAAGDIRVIIGTHSFLGQGWDAPALNSLILGANLARFVAVNQLRGRALRIDRGAPGKASNIWHLAITPGAEIEGEDIDRLRRRFDCFARLDRSAGAIRSHFAPQGEVTRHNETTTAMARSHGALAGEWRDALHSSGDFEARLLRETSIGAGMRRMMLPVSGLPLRERIRWIFGRGPSDDEIRRRLRRMARLVVEALRELGDFAPAHDPRPELTESAGGYQISLRDASRLEESLFHEVLRQTLDPVRNPRYIIVVRSGLFRRRFQYFAVPERFAGHKKRAEIFWRNWQGAIGRGNLIFTRTVAGRGELQAARLNSHARRISTHLSWR
ncbi:MAG: DEAD/DEAH box helicase family protein [Pikeienuella sp.]